MEWGKASQPRASFAVGYYPRTRCPRSERTSVHRPFHRPVLAFHTILRAMPYPTQPSPVCSRLIIVLVHPTAVHTPSRIPEPPPNTVFFVFIEEFIPFARSCNGIGQSRFERQLMNDDRTWTMRMTQRSERCLELQMKEAEGCCGWRSLL